MISNVIADNKTQVYPFAASTAHARGNLLYWDTSAHVAKSAGQQADQLSEQANQRLFASLFCGVMQDVRIVTETAAGDRVVVADGLFDCTCTSDTFDPGDMIAACEVSAGDALENLKVKKTTDAASAIGYAVKYYGSATTTVRCRLVSRFNPTVMNAGTTAVIAGDLTLASGADLIFSGTTGQSKIGIADNLADALSVTESANAYLTFCTTNAAESVKCIKNFIATLGITSISPTGSGIGYATGAGGAVTQATDRSTGVTLSKLTGQITTNNASLAAGAEAEFTVTNTQVAATDTIVLSITPGGTGTPFAYVSSVGAGSFKITVTNLNAATADTSADVINYAVFKGVAA